MEVFRWAITRKYKSPLILWLFVGGRLLRKTGTIFAWDLRSAQEPIPLSHVGLDETAQPVCESEVWEVLFGNYTESSDIISSVSTRILPVMLCSEDGILAIVEQGETLPRKHWINVSIVDLFHANCLRCDNFVTRWEASWIACRALCYQLLWYRSSEPFCKFVCSRLETASFFFFLVLALIFSSYTGCRLCPGMGIDWCAYTWKRCNGRGMNAFTPQQFYWISMHNFLWWPVAWLLTLSFCCSSAINDGRGVLGVYHLRFCVKSRIV